MGQFIARLERDGVERFLLWSEVVDAPVSYLLSEEQLTAYIKDEKGQEGLRELPARLERARRYGTSLLEHRSVEEACYPNRAGKRESCLRVSELWDAYSGADPEPRLA